MKRLAASIGLAAVLTLVLSATASVAPAAPKSLAPAFRSVQAVAAQAQPMSKDYCRRKLRGEAPDGNGANDNDWGRVWNWIEAGYFPNRGPTQLDSGYVEAYSQPHPLQVFVLVTYVSKSLHWYQVSFECWRTGLVPTGAYQDDWYTWGNSG